MKYYRCEVWVRKAYRGIYSVFNLIDGDISCKYENSTWAMLTKDLEVARGIIDGKEICFFTELGVIKHWKLIQEAEKFWKENGFKFRIVEVEKCEHIRDYYDGEQAFFNKKYYNKFKKVLPYKFCMDLTNRIECGNMGL